MVSIRAVVALSKTLGTTTSNPFGKLVANMRAFFASFR
jgi:hypothetical protein